ncbi:Molybdopterin-synthase adenylyltransferase [Handroanthus impetiginosus]|uniref:Molybdopterin-synthase adenylyltransferase n=1 Tax=Handroanthus impetiginosus TaxID=429701 RepID=A0A2G9GX33_9LAMI|nr:Molybdopterin-synthase adenylyltransferase [Handroanthus impetiginosus]
MEWVRSCSCFAGGVGIVDEDVVELKNLHKQELRYEPGTITLSHHGLEWVGTWQVAYGLPTGLQDKEYAPAA